MSDSPKVVDLPQPKNVLAAAGEELRRNLDTMIENQKTIAQFRRGAYLAYIEAGFTADQALQLCVK